MRKTILVCVALVFGAMPLAAVTATVVQVQGTVNVQSGGPWMQARVGMTLAQGASITTGYRSAVLVRIDPTGSVVRLNQFTTVSVARLGDSGGTVNTEMRLKMGTVRAVVKNTVTARSRFQISTPVATASVRGTIPEVSHYPDSGTRISYLQGSGYVLSKKGRLQILARNQQSKITHSGSATTAAQESLRARATASISVNLTPGEQDSLLRNGSGRPMGGGDGMRDRFRDLRKWKYLRETISDPVML